MSEIQLKEIREKRNLTQDELAELSGVRQSTISNIELGHTVNPGLDTLQKLSKALGVSLDELTEKKN